MHNFLLHYSSTYSNVWSCVSSIHVPSIQRVWIEAKFNGIMSQINLLLASGIAKSFGPVVFNQSSQQPPDTPATPETTQQPPVTPATPGTTQQPSVTPATSGTTQQPPVTPATPGTTQQSSVTPATPGTTQQPSVTPATSGTTQQPPVTPATPELLNSQLFL